MMVYPGTQIWASLVEPGMVVDIDGESFPVVNIDEGYDTFTYFDGVSTVEVDYGSLVTVLGYFNP